MWSAYPKTLGAPHLLVGTRYSWMQRTVTDRMNPIVARWYLNTERGYSCLVFDNRHSHDVMSARESIGLTTTLYCEWPWHGEIRQVDRPSTRNLRVGTSLWASPISGPPTFEPSLNITYYITQVLHSHYNVLTSTDIKTAWCAVGWCTLPVLTGSRPVFTARQHGRTKFFLFPFSKSCLATMSY